MKFGLVSSAVPLIQGGGRFIVDWLAPKLVEAGHQVEHDPSRSEELTAPLAVRVVERWNAAIVAGNGAVWYKQ
jgi:hypothetical protein